MITTLLSAFVFSAPAVHGEPLACPMMGGNADHSLASSDYNGTRYWYCCPGCKSGFEKDPVQALRADKLKGKTSGVFLFDPVSGNRLEHDKAIKGSSDFGGVRFLFETEANKATFDKNPKKYGTLPAKEALYCAVGKEAVASYAEASGYVDHGGVRYYMCCRGCEAKFAKETDKYAAASATYVKAPGIANSKAKAKEGGR